jgi:hypothetical protein
LSPLRIRSRPFSTSSRTRRTPARDKHFQPLRSCSFRWCPLLPALDAQPTDWTIGVFDTSSSSRSVNHNFIEAPFDINIDAQNNVWFANLSGGNLSAISSSRAPLACVFEEDNGTRGGGTIDAANNVWFGVGTTMYRYNPTTKTRLGFPVGASRRLA